MSKNDNSSTVSFYLDADIVNTLKKLAKEDERSLSSELSIILKRAFKREGIEIVKAESDDE